MHLMGGPRAARCIFRNDFPLRRCLSPRVRNGVVAKLARKWMAPQQPLQSKPYAAQHTEPFNRRVGVARAGRFEPATSRKPYGQIGFIKPKCQERNPHRRTRLDKRCNSLRPVFSSRLSRGRRHSYFPPCTELGSSPSKSAVTTAKGVCATEFLGCMTMSHPAGI